MGLLRKLSGIVRGKGINTLLRYILAYSDYKTGLLGLMLMPSFLKTFKLIKDWIDALNFVFSDNLMSWLIRPMQLREEISQLMEILSNFKPKTVLEIGTARGGTLFLWTRIASSDALLISIDLPGGPFGGGYPIFRSVLYKSFAINKQQIKLLRADSHDPHTFKKVKNLIRNKGIDFLFIDGDHSYEGVKRDYEMYSPLVRSGGIIAIHDIVPGPRKLVGEVPRFWRELKQSIPSGSWLEIVRNWNQGGYGIGVIFK